jgi:hypothetical protein
MKPISGWEVDYGKFRENVANHVSLDSFEKAMEPRLNVPLPAIFFKSLINWAKSTELDFKKENPSSEAMELVHLFLRPCYSEKKEFDDADNVLFKMDINGRLPPNVRIPSQVTYDCVPYVIPAFSVSCFSPTVGKILTLLMQMIIEAKYPKAATGFCWPWSSQTKDPTNLLDWYDLLLTPSSTEMEEYIEELFDSYPDLKNVPSDADFVYNVGFKCFIENCLRSVFVRTFANSHASNLHAFDLENRNLTIENVEKLFWSTFLNKKTQTFYFPLELVSPSNIATYCPTNPPELEIYEYWGKLIIFAKYQQELSTLQEKKKKPVVVAISTKKKVVLSKKLRKQLCIHKKTTTIMPSQEYCTIQLPH